MVLLKNFKNMFFIPELRKKLFFTLGVLIVYRLGVHIPVVGINVPMLGEYMKRSAGLGGLLSYLDIFSGGALTQCAIFSLGIGPYITASIMMQLLGMTLPYFEQLLKEGEYGRKIINQYTRYLTVGLSIMYASGIATFVEAQGLVLTPGWAFRLMFILSLTVGTLFVMWLGEQISMFGLGNGSSILIFAGIVAHFPTFVLQTITVVQAGSLEIWQSLLILAVFIALIGCVVFLEKGERKIPVQYARRVIGNRVYGGQSSYIPFKINTVGVMPVIFSQAILAVPGFLASAFAEKHQFFKWISEILARGGILFNVLEFGLIIFFSYIYTAMVFNPDELAENIKKSGGFLPGIRPGKKTAEYFNYILTRIGLIGAIYLGFLALAPNILNAVLRMPFYLAGTSLLIVVGVALELAAQIEAYLIEHRYEGFLSSGSKFKSRVAR